MAGKITENEYRALGELRYRIRRFLQEGDMTAKQAGLEPQQYLLLLAIRGLPARQDATISALGDRLSLRHHSSVELIDRMEAHGYVRRTRGREDRRQVLVSLQPRGEKLLEKVVARGFWELGSTAPRWSGPSESCWNRGQLELDRRSGAGAPYERTDHGGGNAFDSGQKRHQRSTSSASCSETQRRTRRLHNHTSRHSDFLA